MDKATKERHDRFYNTLKRRIDGKQQKHRQPTFLTYVDACSKD